MVASLFHSCSILMRLTTTSFAQIMSFPDGTSGAVALAEPPPAHSLLFTSAQAKAMLPTYQRLTSDKLFHCIQGKP